MVCCKTLGEAKSVVVRKDVRVLRDIAQHVQAIQQLTFQIDEVLCLVGFIKDLRIEILLLSDSFIVPSMSEVCTQYSDTLMLLT